MLEFTEARLGPNSKAYKAGRAVKAPEYNSSLEGSTEEDALHAKSRLNTSGTVYTGPQACQLIQKVIRSSACHRRGGWRRSEFCDKRCSDIMKHVLEMVYGPFEYVLQPHRHVISVTLTDNTRTNDDPRR